MPHDLKMTMPPDLDAMSLDELRRRRDDVRDEEESLSYRRRLLHAQLDLVRAAAGVADREDFDAMVAEVLEDGPSGGRGDVRAVAVSAPDGGEPEPLPADLVGLSEDDRRSLLARLEAEEQAISARRRELLDELDALQDELVRRYRRDGVDARALLGEDG